MDNKLPDSQSHSSQENVADPASPSDKNESDFARSTRSKAKAKPSKKPKKPKKKISRKKKWGKRLLWFLVIIAILTFFINGIIARKTAEHFLNETLEDQGMTGSHTVEGTIGSGLKVLDLDYTGEQGLQKLKADRAEVSYSISGLLDRKIKLVALENTTAIIDINKFPTTEETTEEEEDKEPFNKEDLADLRHIILSPEINITNLDVTILQDGAKLLHWKLGSLTHQPGSDEIKLNQWQVSNADGISTPTQDATFTWTDYQLQCDKLELIPNIALEKIQLDWENDLKGNTTIRIHDAIIAADITDHLNISLTSGQLETSKILPTIASLGVDLSEIDPSLDVNLSALDFKIPIADFSKTVPNWNTTASLTTSSAKYLDYDLKNTTISLQQKDANYALQLDATALDAPAQFSLSGTWTKPDLTTWSENTTANLDFEITASPKLTKLIPETIELPQELDLEKTNIKGNLSAVYAFNQLFKSNATLSIKDTHIDNTPLPTLLIEADSKTLLQPINFSVKTIEQAKPQQEPLTSIHIKGDYSLFSQNYKASLNALTSSRKSTWINDIAGAFDVPMTLQDKINIQWSGKGNIERNQHSGELSQLELKINQIDAPTTSVNLTTNYNWPKSLDISQLTVEQDELLAEVSLGWDGKEVNIRQSQLKQDGDLIANMQGSIPFSTDIITPEAYLAQDTPWNLNIVTEKLVLDRIATLIPSADLPDLSGFVQANINLSGSPKTPNLNVKIDAQQRELDAKLNLSWDNKTLTIQDSIINLEDQPLASISGQLPLTTDITSAEDYLAQEIPWKLQINTEKIVSEKLATLLPSEDLSALNGFFQTNINLTGTPKQPILDIALSAEQDELGTELKLNWDSKTLKIDNANLTRENERIATINGTLPLTTEFTNIENYLASNTPWNLQINTEELFLNKLKTFIPDTDIPELSGTVKANLSLTGSPKNPILNGSFNANNVKDSFDLGLDELNFSTKIKTVGEKITITGDLAEKDQERIALNFDLPFTPHDWLKDDNLADTLLKNSQVNGEVEIKRLPLDRFKALVPDVNFEKLEGFVEAKAKLSGTLDDPQYSVDYNAEFPVIRIKNAGVDDITNLKLSGTIDQKMILTGQLDAKINGGKFNTLYTVDLNDPTNPVFDVRLLTEYAMLYRDDTVTARANINLALKGTIEQAEISGDVGIVESLFYKDVDILPIGVPSSAVDEVSLPALNPALANELPVPEPFNNWTLNVTLRAEDPILLRGNVGRGRIEGDVKINGRIGKPVLDGSLSIINMKATLPFSELFINNGKIIFSPRKGLVPELQIIGKSQVGTHNVTLNVFGSADAPQTALSSLPALEESQIMTLLATGATSEGLDDRDVATFKTLQLILAKLKHKNDQPGGNKLFGKVLAGIQNLGLRVGETNQLTGEKYASATVELHRRWFLTAQLAQDSPVQTRGLLVFALRFN